MEIYPNLSNEREDSKILHKAQTTMENKNKKAAESAKTLKYTATKEPRKS